MNAIAPNSYSLVNKVEPINLTRPIVSQGTDKEYPHEKEWPRRYHKYLNNRDKANIYGNEVADAANGNAVRLTVLPLNAQQEDFLDQNINDYFVE